MEQWNWRSRFRNCNRNIRIGIIMIYQKLADNTLVPFTEGKVTDGTNTISISNGTARVWAKTNKAHLNKWNLYNPKIVVLNCLLAQRMLYQPPPSPGHTQSAIKPPKKWVMKKPVKLTKCPTLYSSPCLILKIVFEQLLEKTSATKSPLSNTKMLTKLKTLLSN